MTRPLKLSLVLLLSFISPAVAVQIPNLDNFKVLFWNEKLPTDFSQQKYGLVINSSQNSALVELDGEGSPCKIENIPKNVHFKAGDTLVCYIKDNSINCEKLEGAR